MAESLDIELSDISIHSLHLGARATNSLSKGGVSNAFTLRQKGLDGVLSLPGVGEKTKEEVGRILNCLSESSLGSDRIDFLSYLRCLGVELLDYGLAPHPTEAEVLLSLGEIVGDVLHKLDDERLRVIIQRRFGLSGGPRLTLEDLALAYGVTRERIRQLESSALRALQDTLIEASYADYWFHVHPAILTRIDRVAVFLDEFCSAGANEQDIALQLSGRFNLPNDPLGPETKLLLTLLGFSKLSFHQSQIAPIWGKWAGADKRIFTSTVEAAHTLLTSDTPQPLSVIDILIRINRDRKKSNRIDRSFLETVLRACPSIEPAGDNFYQGRFEYLGTRAQQVERILSESGDPLHFKDIARELSHRIATQGEGPINPRTLVNQLSVDSRFTPIGKSGDWALSDWSLETASILDIMVRCLVSRNEPQTLTEIFLYVTKRRPAQKSSVEAYLTFDDRFVRLIDDKWGLASWEEAEDLKYWDPERVAAFVESMFKESNRRKLPYSDIKSALMSETGLRPRQAMGMLNVNPVISTQDDAQTSELIAVFNPSFREELEQVGARIARKKPTLREQTRARVQEILSDSSTGRMSLGKLVDQLCDELEGSRRTFYSYISDLNFIEKVEVPGSSERIVQLAPAEELEDSPAVSEIHDMDLRRNIRRALTFLNEEEVDVGLFLLAKEFESTLRSYIELAEEQGAIKDVPEGRLSLDRMITVLKKEAIITDQAILQFLRQRRNDRAHGPTPSLQERRVMMRHAHSTAEMYIDYIRFFADLKIELKDRQ